MSSSLLGQSLIPRVLWRLHGVIDSSPINSLVLNDCEVANQNKSNISHDITWTTTTWGNHIIPHYITACVQNISNNCSLSRKDTTSYTCRVVVVTITVIYSCAWSGDFQQTTWNELLFGKILNCQNICIVYSANDKNNNQEVSLHWKHIDLYRVRNLLVFGE